MSPERTRHVILLGNPNAGKTTLFNQLTGASVHVGNYPGVTVERTVRHLRNSATPILVSDVPGAYSLCARSPEESMAVESLLGSALSQSLLGLTPTEQSAPPDLVVLVVDAQQLERNLYFTLQVLELGLPTLVVLNQIDVAARRGVHADAEGLEAWLGAPVFPVVSIQPEHIQALSARIVEATQNPPPPAPWRWRPNASLRAEIEALRPHLPQGHLSESGQEALALWALMSLEADQEGPPAPLRTLVEAQRANAEAADRDVDAEIAAARYAAIHEAAPRFIKRSAAQRVADRVDRVLLHPVAGFALFIFFMIVIFQALFAWAEPVIGWIEEGVAATGDFARGLMPEGLFTDFVVEALINGVGNVVVFVPQITLLFVFLGVMEDSGYMARVAFLMDRIMRRVGLHGRAFVPMLSGFACAIPAVMATRTLERERDRILTMMVIPLMTCSARLPVYTLLIAAVIPDSPIFGPIGAQSLVMVSLYLFAVVIALVAGAVLGRTVLKGAETPLLLELPDYRRPTVRSVGRLAVDRSWAFIRGAGTIILVFTGIMWALLTFPQQTPGSEAVAAQITTQEALPETHFGSAEAKAEHLEELQKREQAVRLEESIAGRMGHAMEPVIAPLGFTWEVGIGILGAFAAREVFVSTMGVVYGVGADVDEESEPLRKRMAVAKHRDGSLVYTPLMGLSLMIFFALACQCMSTLAAVKRETKTWRWPALLFTYMTVLAYICALVVYQGGKALGFA